MRACRVRSSGLYVPAVAAGAGVLLAQLAWNRYLLVLIGGSVDSAAAVLTAFMLGLGLGGRHLGRMAERSPSPRRLLGRVLMLTAALSLVPMVLVRLLLPVYPLLYNSPLPAVVVRFLLACATLLPATFFAGGIIPVMGRIAETGGAQSEVSRLYGLNALASAAGGFAAGFLLLEVLGASLTLLGGALLCAGAAPLVGRGRERPVPPPDVPLGRPSTFLMAVYGLSGMVALGYEVIWTRQLTFVLGNSTYAFATMGIVFLTGIGLGSLAGQRVATRSGRPLLVLGLVELGLGISSMLPLAALGSFGSLSSMLTAGGGWTAATAASFLTAAMYMLPSTVLMGATFPLMLSAAARRERLGSDTGMLSMANCIGAAAGALVTSQVLLRLAGPTVIGAVLAFGSVLLGAVILLRSGGTSAVAAAPATALVVLVSVGSTPPGSIPPEGLSVLFFSEDRNATVSVFGREWDDYRSLRINGVEEVPVDQASLEAFYMLGHLPWGYSPGASDVMVVALGGGITAGAALTHPVDTLVCVELCPSVLEALPLFEEENRRPDLDPRFTLVADDGRNYLLGSGQRFDAVICDATHPGSSDSWVLYTEEFYGTVLGSLEEDGVAVQWLPLHQLPVLDLRRILATWARVFPYGSVHLAGGRHAILAGSPEPLELDPEAMMDAPGAEEQLASVGFSRERPAYLQPVVTDAGLDLLAEDGPASNTDDHAPCQFIRRRAPLDPQATIAPDVAELVALGGSGLDSLRQAQMLYWSGDLPGAMDILRASAEDPMERRWLAVVLTTAAEQLWVTGRGLDAEQLLQEAIQADPAWDRHRLLLDAILEDPLGPPDPSRRRRPRWAD